MLSRNWAALSGGWPPVSWRWLRSFPSSAFPCRAGLIRCQAEQALEFAAGVQQPLQPWSSALWRRALGPWVGGLGQHLTDVSASSPLDLRTGSSRVLGWFDGHELETSREQLLCRRRRISRWERESKSLCFRGLDGRPRGDMSRGGQWRQKIGVVEYEVFGLLCGKVGVAGAGAGTKLLQLPLCPRVGVTACGEIGDQRGLFGAQRGL